LRGLAGLSIVIWHFQHFYHFEQSFIRNSQPYYNLLYFFYNHGHLAVAIFFSLSGFIFFWLYYEKIKNQLVSGKEFFLLRFSRLYPLHFITLIIVCLLQLYSIKKTGSYIIYNNNDLKHFLLNLFFISGWGGYEGPSYNAPIWSVSLELFAYICFFLFSKYIYKKKYIIFLVIICLTFINSRFAFVCYYFFVGGLAYLALTKINIKNNKMFYKMILLILIMIISGFIFFNYNNHLSKRLDAINLGIINFTLILALAITQSKFKKIGNKLSKIGNLTYASYLWHFPIQLVILLFFKDIFFYNVNISFLFYIFFVILLSILSYKFIEISLKNKIRKFF
jgi:peptidoglycan/LPS O-acetylase OafA/YrhL